MGMLGAERLLADLERFFEEGVRFEVSSDAMGKSTRLVDVRRIVWLELSRFPEVLVGLGVVAKAS